LSKWTRKQLQTIPIYLLNESLIIRKYDSDEKCSKIEKILKRKVKEINKLKKTYNRVCWAPPPPPDDLKMYWAEFLISKGIKWKVKVNGIVKSTNWIFEKTLKTYTYYPPDKQNYVEVGMILIPKDLLDKMLLLNDLL